MIIDKTIPLLPLLNDFKIQAQGTHRVPFRCRNNSLKKTIPTEFKIMAGLSKIHIRVAFGYELRYAMRTLPSWVTRKVFSVTATAPDGSCRERRQKNKCHLKSILPRSRTWNTGAKRSGGNHAHIKAGGLRQKLAIAFDANLKTKKSPS